MNEQLLKQIAALTKFGLETATSAIAQRASYYQYLADTNQTWAWIFAAWFLTSGVGCWASFKKDLETPTYLFAISAILSLIGTVACTIAGYRYQSVALYPLGQFLG